jgi:hypothetical protein
LTTMGDLSACKSKRTLIQLLTVNTDLTVFKYKYASKCEELDVLRVEVAELKSRPTLLGACTSRPVLHGKIDEMHPYTVSLEAKLKEPVPTSCSTC